jgi:hypothetical protein
MAMLAQVACTGVAYEQNEQETVGETDQNLLSGNLLSGNLLSGNLLSGNLLSGNLLSGNLLSGNSVLEEELKDPGARELLSFIVSCALPAGDQVDVEVEGVTYEFNGSIGLAPEWGEEGGSCDSECRSWVSACVISRVNYLHEHVDISIRGKHAALKSTHAEREDFPFVEATYYGDIFASPPKIFACLPPGMTQIPRVCGPDVDDCVVVPQGECEDLCGNTTKDGAYPNCREQGKPKKHGGYHQGAKHQGSITVFLAPDSP